MIAIPIDVESLDEKSSKLFGNVELFAIYKTQDKDFVFLKNTEAGNGVKTAKLLKTWNVTDTVYSYMGDGPFNSLMKDNINVHYIGKEPMEISDIVEKVQSSSFIKVDKSNSSTYLDPGTATENCECSCSH